MSSTMDLTISKISFPKICTATHQFSLHGWTYKSQRLTWNSTACAKWLQRKTLANCHHFPSQVVQYSVTWEKSTLESQLSTWTTGFYDIKELQTDFQAILVWILFLRHIHGHMTSNMITCKHSDRQFTYTAFSLFALHREHEIRHIYCPGMDKKIFSERVTLTSNFLHYMTGHTQFQK